MYVYSGEVIFHTLHRHHILQHGDMILKFQILLLSEKFNSTVLLKLLQQPADNKA